MKTNRVELVYFQTDGTFYNDGSYDTHKDKLGDIWQEVADKRRLGILPNLKPGHSHSFIIQVLCPGLRPNNPRLIV